MRHQLHAAGYSDPDRIMAGLRGLTDNDCQADRRWERREGLPVYVLGKYRFENGLAWLMDSNHT